MKEELRELAEDTMVLISVQDVRQKLMQHDWLRKSFEASIKSVLDERGFGYYSELLSKLIMDRIIGVDE